MPFIEGTDGGLRRTPTKRTAARRPSASRGRKAPTVRGTRRPKKDDTGAMGRRLAAKPVQPFKPKPTFVAPVSMSRPTVPKPTSTTKLTTGGGAGGIPTGIGPSSPAAATKQTSVTDSEQEKKRQEDEAKAAAVKSADEVLASQLAAIAASFDMTEAQLMADEGEAGRQFRLAAMGLMRQREAQIEASFNNLVERGILQSGMTLQAKADAAEAYETGRGTAAGDRDYKIAQIEAQRGALPAQEAAEVAAANAEHERTILDLETLEALAEGGVG